MNDKQRKAIERKRALREAIVKGIVFAREHFHEAKDADIAIAIEVQLREAGFRLPYEQREESAPAEDVHTAATRIAINKRRQLEGER